MSKVLKVNQGDYVVQVRSGGDIVLDIGDTGYVTVTGNLRVIGNSTQINTTNLNVSDNIIVLNQDETGSGVTLGSSGIEIDRGLLNNAQLLWVESVNHYDPLLSSNTAGTFVARIKNGNVTGLQVSTLVTGGGNLTFDMQNSSNVMQVANTTNYEQRVTDTNHIPNRKFVTDYVSATGGSANVNNIHYPLTGTANVSVTASNSTIDFVISGQLKSRMSASGVAVNNILLSGDTITNGTNNLKLTATNNNVEVSSIFNLDNVEALSGSYSTTAVSGTNKIYSSSTAGPGNTGIYFSNTNNADELMSRRRAVLLSVLL